MFFTGCSYFQQSSLSPTFDKNQLLNTFKEREVEVNTLWSNAKIVIKGKALKGKTFFESTIIYKNPDTLRIRGYRSIAGTLFDGIIVNDIFLISSIKENRVYSGTLNSESPNIPSYLKIHPKNIINSILINNLLSQDAQREDFFNTIKSSFGNKYYVIEEKNSDSKITYYINKKDMLPKKVILEEATPNQSKITITYKKYTSFENKLFPSEFSISSKSPKMNINVKIMDMKINPPKLSDKVFEYVPPSEYEVVNI